MDEFAKPFRGRRESSVLFFPGSDLGGDPARRHRSRHADQRTGGRRRGHRRFVVVRQFPARRDPPGLIGGDPVLAPIAGRPGPGEFGELAPRRLEQPLGKPERRKVGIGEIPVVLGFLLAPHGLGHPPRLVVEAGFLHELPSGGQDFALAPLLVFERPLEEPERVQVLQLHLDPVVGFAAPPDRNVAVHPQVALLHVGIGYAAIDDPAPQLARVGARLGRRTHVRVAHDLDEGHPGAVEVHPAAAVRSGEPLVDQLSGVLLDLDPVDPDGAFHRLAVRPGIQPDVDRPRFRQRKLVLRDLVALGKVRIEVVLPLEDRLLVDLAVEREPREDRQFHRSPVGHRKRPGQPVTDRTQMGVRRRTELVRAPAEQFRPGVELDVHLQPDDGLEGIGHRVPEGTVRRRAIRSGRRTGPPPPGASPSGWASAPRSRW